LSVNAVATKRPHPYRGLEVQNLETKRVGDDEEEKRIRENLVQQWVVGARGHDTGPFGTVVNSR